MKKIILVILSIAFVASCSKDDNNKPENGKVSIDCSLEYKLSTGEVKSKSIEMMYVLWNADNNKNYDIYISDLGDGYNYDSTSQKSYHYIDLTSGYTYKNTLPPGRYFIFVIMTNTDHNDPPYLSNSCTYFTLKAGDNINLTKIFGENTISLYHQDW